MREFYIRKTSLMHNLDFWTKFLCLLLILPLAGFLAPTTILPVLIGVLLILLISSKISLKKFWGLTRFYVVPITIGVIILSLFFSPGTLSSRLIQGLVLAIRFTVLISFGILFAVVTSPIEIPVGFTKARIPHKYGITIMVAFRTLPLISQKVKNIIDAQKARGAEIKVSLRNLPKLPPLFMSLIIPILHSALEISVRLSDTLMTRGYNPDSRITIPPSRFQKFDYILLLFSAALLFWINIGF